MPTQTHKAESLIECQIYCEKHPRFAIMVCSICFIDNTMTYDLFLQTFFVS